MTENVSHNDAGEEPTDADSDHRETDPDVGPANESLTDPESLGERDDVEYAEKTDTDHCGVGVDGKSIVGITNDDGAVLVLVHREAGVAMLPNGDVEPGADFASVARRIAAEKAGLAVDLAGPERVRKYDHVREDAAEPHTTTHHVLFRASPATDETGTPEPRIDSEDWDARWEDELPAELRADAEDIVADIEAFLD